MLLTGEDGGYYADYANDPAAKLARVLAEGWVYQGERSAYLKAPRGEPSADLPPYAHVLFLQNHDQIGNRAFGERLTIAGLGGGAGGGDRAATSVSSDPAAVHGRRNGGDAHRSYSLPITTMNWRMRCGRGAGRSSPASLNSPIPRSANIFRIQMPPTTFTASVPRAESADRFALYQRLIALRMKEIVPRLPGTKSLGAEAIGPEGGLGAMASGRWLTADDRNKPGNGCGVVRNAGGPLAVHDG